MVKRILKAATIFNFEYTGFPQQITLSKGIYQFECWGASGELFTEVPLVENGCLTSGGRGAYVSGFIKLNKTEQFFVYVGEKGKGQLKPIFNNNNLSCRYNGGGATDVRYTGDDWYLFSSLKTRIIVAGSGGSGERSCGGDAGGLSGFANEYGYSLTTRTTPGNQTHGGHYGYWYANPVNSPGHGANGQFGFGGNGTCNELTGNATCDWGPGGGSGYYGGGGTNYAGFGSGGSSFISGHPGCDAIAQESTEDNIIHTKQPDHYSGYVFYNTLMKAGNERMISPTNNFVIGHNGDGFARITKFVNFNCKAKSTNKFDFICFTLIFFLRS